MPADPAPTVAVGEALFCPLSLDGGDVGSRSAVDHSPAVECACGSASPFWALHAPLVRDIGETFEVHFLEGALNTSHGDVDQAAEFLLAKAREAALPDNLSDDWTTNFIGWVEDVPSASLPVVPASDNAVLFLSLAQQGQLFAVSSVSDEFQSPGSPGDSVLGHDAALVTMPACQWEIRIIGLSPLRSRFFYMALLEGSCLGCHPFGTGDLTQSHFAVPEDNDPLYIMADHWGRVTLVFEDADSGYEGMIQLRSLDHLLGCHPGEPWFALCNPGLAIPPRCSPLVCGLYHNDQEGPSAGLCVASSLQIPKRCPQPVLLYPDPWKPGELMGWCIVLRNVRQSLTRRQIWRILTEHPQGSCVDRLPGLQPLGISPCSSHFLDVDDSAGLSIDSHAGSIRLAFVNGLHADDAFCVHLPPVLDLLASCGRRYMSKESFGVPESSTGDMPDVQFALDDYLPSDVSGPATQVDKIGMVQRIDVPSFEQIQDDLSLGLGLSAASSDTGTTALDMVLHSSQPAGLDSVPIPPSAPQGANDPDTAELILFFEQLGRWQLVPPDALIPEILAEVDPPQFAILLCIFQLPDLPPRVPNPMLPPPQQPPQDTGVSSSPSVSSVLLPCALAYMVGGSFEVSTDSSSSESESEGDFSREFPFQLGVWVPGLDSMCMYAPPPPVSQCPGMGGVQHVPYPPSSASSLSFEGRSLSRCSSRNGMECAASGSRSSTPSFTVDPLSRHPCQGRAECPRPDVGCRSSQHAHPEISLEDVVAFSTEFLTRVYSVTAILDRMIRAVNFENTDKAPEADVERSDLLLLCEDLQLLINKTVTDMSGMNSLVQGLVRAISDTVASSGPSTPEPVPCGSSDFRPDPRDPVDVSRTFADLSTLSGVSLAADPDAPSVVFPGFPAPYAWSPVVQSSVPDFLSYSLQPRSLAVDFDSDFQPPLGLLPPQLCGAPAHQWPCSLPDRVDSVFRRAGESHGSRLSSTLGFNYADSASTSRCASRAVMMVLTSPRQVIAKSSTVRHGTPHCHRRRLMTDSGASMHLVQGRRRMRQIQASDRKVHTAMGKDGILQATHEGVLPLDVRQKDGTPVTLCLEGVLVIPQVAQELLSITAIIDSGHTVVYSPAQSGIYVCGDPDRFIPFVRQGCHYYVEEDLESGSDTEHDDEPDDTVTVAHSADDAQAHSSSQPQVETGLQVGMVMDTSCNTGSAQVPPGQPNQRKSPTYLQHLLFGHLNQ